MMKTIRRWLIRVIILLLVSAAVSAYFFGGPEVEDGSYLLVDISGELGEGPPSGQLGRWMGRGETILDLTHNLRKARADGRIVGVVARISPLHIGWARAKQIRDALAAVKTGGKTLIAVVEGEFSGANKEIYVASAADRVYLPEAVSPLFNGLSAHFLFLGGLWEHLNVKVQVEQIREYKSAGDTIARRDMSAAHREMADSLLDDVNEHFLETIAGARNLEVDEVRSLIESCPSTAVEFVDAGLVDGVRSTEAVLLDLGSGKRPPIVSGADYTGITMKSLGLGGGPKLALIHATGNIVRGKTIRGSGSAGSRSVSNSLRKAAEDDEIKAIVFRINSPGGSPAASDEIWQALREAGKKKPVVASMGDVAGSGGYYIASAAEHIIAEPTTLTGSIGVVLFKPNIAGILDRFDIGRASLERGRFARLMSLGKDFDEEELAIIRKQMNSIYRLFVNRVRSGRGMTFEQVDRIGGGRVWTGKQAVGNGLVDELGGLDDAIRVAAAAAGINDADSVELVYYPKLAGVIDSILEARSSSALQVRELLPAALRAELTAVDGFFDLEPGVYTMMSSIPLIE